MFSGPRCVPVIWSGTDTFPSQRISCTSNPSRKAVAQDADSPPEMGCEIRSFRLLMVDGVRR